MFYICFYSLSQTLPVSYQCRLIFHLLSFGMQLNSFERPEIALKLVRLNAVSVRILPRARSRTFSEQLA